MRSTHHHLAGAQAGDGGSVELGGGLELCARATSAPRSASKRRRAHLVMFSSRAKPKLDASAPK